MKTFLTIIQQKFNQTLTNINRYKREEPFDISFGGEIKGMEEEKKLFLKFSCGETKLSLAFPIPYRDEAGSLLIGRRVKRAVGSWHHQGKEMNYWQLMTWLLTENLEKAIPDMGKRIQMERLLSGFATPHSALIFRDVQRLIDGFVNGLPLAGTPYEAWAMCQRVVFLDLIPNGTWKNQETGEQALVPLEKLQPKAAVAYQKDLNIKHFPWTSIGLSDSSMTSNYLLKEDLRKYTPYAIKHHNPKRNLYQTLGMRGDETPVLLSTSAKKLAEQGVERTGWNLMTCFLDLPLNFEDQLIIDLRHLDKLTCEERKFVCFGEPKVYAGDDLSEGQVLSVEPGEKEVRYWVKADSSVVSEICEDVIPFNGGEKKVHVITVRTKHGFKEGVKLTNTHGNKGVATFADCGYMVDAGKGVSHPIDIIVAARTIGKRKNYGQVLEALTTLIAGKDQEIVLPDNASVNKESLAKTLTELGYNPDGTSVVKTQWGKFEAICGWIFWGVIKNPENQLWRKAEVMATDNRQLRTAGLKISHIELKGLMTIFGPKNPVVEEILSYQQGLPDVLEMVKCLSIMEGSGTDMPVLSWRSVKPLEQKDVYFHEKGAFVGTIVDETLQPEGFAMELPKLCHVYVPENEKEPPALRLLPFSAAENLEKHCYQAGKNVFFDKLIVPSTRLRNSWQHPTGLWGMSDLGAVLNTLISACHRVEAGDAEEVALLKAVDAYFNHLSTRLSTKAGEISTYALSVRYPRSAKATATLAKSGELEENTVEIHRSMAQDLKVRTGDLVIAERFPCLGFKSLRIQKVKVSDDPQCEYVIRVSGNSLVSQNLDFDGDVLFLMSFQNKASRELLKKEFENPDPLRKHYLDVANAEKQPTYGTVRLPEISLEPFPTLTPEEQAEIVAALTGVKRGTGTAVALSYNLMRIIEGKVGYQDTETNLALEVILDKVANSVFSQKHSGVSLEERCRAAVCRANLKEMLEMGFPEAGSKKLCEIIETEAAQLGIRDLEKHFKAHLEKGYSNIINLIVRRNHRLYFATRANLHPARLLEHLLAPASDLVSHLWHRNLNRTKDTDVKEAKPDIEN